MSDKSYFRVVTPKKCDTILHSRTPSSAAAKAYTHCVHNKSTSKKTKGKRKSRLIQVQRRTQSPSKIFSYRVKQVNEPTRVMRDGKVIDYGFKVKVKSVRK